MRTHGVRRFAAAEGERPVSPRPEPFDRVKRLRELSENAVGGDLLPPAWAEFVSLVPGLLDRLDRLEARNAAALHELGILRVLLMEEP